MNDEHDEENASRDLTGPARGVEERRSGVPGRDATYRTDRGVEAILSAADVAALVLDRRLRVVTCTPKMTDLFGTETRRGERPISHFDLALFARDLPKDAVNALRHNRPAAREVRSGTDRWYSVRVQPWTGNGDLIKGVVVAFFDVSDQKRAEEQVRKLVRRFRTAGDRERRRIAHLLHDDLQQVLFAVDIKLGIIQKDVERADYGKVARDVEDARKWMTRAVATTRQLAMDLHRGGQREEGLIAALEPLRHYVHELYGLEVAVEADREEHVRDGKLLQVLVQAVRELLFNVAKHAGVDRAVVRLAREGDRLVIHVIDDGRGYDPVEASSRDASTSGFGLATMGERLRQCGGRLEIDSEPGRGTHVRIYSPAGEAQG